MASVNEVYSILKDLTNKDARGMVTPSQFNSFAGVAQTRIFNGLFNELQKFNRLGLVSTQDGGRDKARMKQIQEDLSYFSKTSTIGAVSGVFQKPSDLARIISMNTSGDWVLDSTSSERIKVVYEEEKIDMLLKSTLSIPTEDNPVALVSNDILVFPTSIRKIKLRYYKQPEGISSLDGTKTSALPRFGYTVSSNGVEVFDVLNSVDFELPDHYVQELVIEIAKMIGVSIRENDVFTYASQEQQIKTNK
jgi:hypothetical protein